MGNGKETFELEAGQHGDGRLGEGRAQTKLFFVENWNEEPKWVQLDAVA